MGGMMPGLSFEDPAAIRLSARFSLIEVDADADLFEALWLMVQHRVHRVLVRDGAGID